MSLMSRPFFIDTIAPLIQTYARKYGFKCVSGIIAQACLESNFGLDNKGATYHNYFGLKYRNGRVSTHCGYFKAGSKEEYTKGQLTNIEGTWYKFSDMDSGVEGYFQFIVNGPYPVSLLKTADNPRSYLILLKNAKYATDSNYVEKCMSIVTNFDLTRFDKEVTWTVSDKKVFNVHGGHNKKCPGAHGYFDEVTEDRKVAAAVIKYLRAAGHTVYDCTDDDGATANANLRNIVAKCNKHEVAIDISIHFNASGGGGHGTEVWVWKLDRNKNATAIDAANRVVKRIAAEGFTNRGVKENELFYVLKWTNAPAILVECCFCDNSTDNAVYKRMGADHMGYLIACGVLGVKDINAKESKAEVPKTKKVMGKATTKVYEVTGALLQGEAAEVVKETDKFYVLPGNRYVLKEDVDVL